jgi:AMP-polyphosphate phosphotransferase
MLEQVDLSLKIPKNEYNNLIEPLGYRLVELQRRCREAGIPIVVVYEGWDAAGKGGSVNQLMRLIDPRGFKVYGTEAPVEGERMRPFLWRFAIRMPSRGFMAIFIRSWYGRVLVERVEKLVNENEWRKAYEDINSFERQLADDGTVIIKFWLHISTREQRQRFEEMEKDPYDSWRAKPANWENRNQYKSYVKAIEEMLQQTSNPSVPWTIIEAEDKYFGRLKTYETLARLMENALIERERLAKMKIPYGFHIDPSAYRTIVLKSERFLKSYDLTKKIEDRKKYKERLGSLQMKARQMHNRLFLGHTAAVVVFEGWDASGKGGAIKRLVAQLDTRRFEVVTTFMPTSEELAQHYLWRFWKDIPKKGFLTIFDRSWYGRVLVERVEGLCPTEAWQRAYKEINEFEKMLVDERILIVKFWLQIDKEEQLRRFKTREDIPYKNWKITEEDWRNRGKWEEYEMAVADMIQKTSTTYAPWTVVASNDKYFSRIKVLETFIETVSTKLSGEKAGKRARRE